MPVAKLITRLCLLAALVCAALVVLAVELGNILPYGGEIAFVSSQDGDMDIYLLDINSHFLLNLTDNQYRVDFSPFWTPDGNHLAFLSQGIYGEIYMANAIGNDLQQISGFRRTANMVWSPDGKYLAISTEGWLSILEVELAERCSYDYGVVMNSRCSYVVFRGNYERVYISDWSSKSDEILFSLQLSEGIEIYSFSLESNHLRQLTYNHYVDAVAQWSKNEERIFISAVQGNSGWRGLIMDSTGTNIEPIEDNISSSSPWSWSPDQTMFAYTSYDGNDSEVFVADLGTRAVLQLTNNNSDDLYPVWSPEGSRIAFVTRNDLGDSELYVVNIDGSGMHRIADDVWWLSSPAWRP